VTIRILEIVVAASSGFLRLIDVGYWKTRVLFRAIENSNTTSAFVSASQIDVVERHLFYFAWHVQYSRSKTALEYLA